MLASTVFDPTASALNRNNPSRTTVPASTRAPLALATGSGSPLIMLSSMRASPPTTVPSTGTFSPARTSTVSPGCNAEMGASATMPPSTRWAVFGASPISALMAEAVPFLARSSMSLPVSTKVTIITEAS